MIPEGSHIRLVRNIVLGVTAALAVTLAALMIFVTTEFGGNALFPAECGVVFGTAVHGKNTAGPGITRRTATAAGLLKEGKLLKLYLTGGRGSETQDSEASVMRKVAMLEGVAPEKITTEDRSTSTLENVQYVKELTKDCDGVVAVSDRYHLARIEYLAKRYDWNVQTFPASDVAPWPFELKSVAREAVGLLYYFVVRE